MAVRDLNPFVDLAQSSESGLLALIELFLVDTSVRGESGPLVVKLKIYSDVKIY